MYNYKLQIRAILILSILGFPLSSVSAQVLQRDTITKSKQGVEIIRFGDDDEGNKNSKPVSTTLFKVAPLAFIAGYFPVFIERELNDWLSVQAGIGATFKSNTDQLLGEFGNELYSDSDTYIDYSYRKVSPGVLLSLSPRLYFDNDGFEGSYLSSEIRFSTLNTKAQKPDPLNRDFVLLGDEFDKESSRYLDLMIHYGKQTLYPKLALDWSIGAGIRNTNSSLQTVNQNNAGYWISSFEKSNNTRFRLQLGLRVGFQL